MSRGEHAGASGGWSGTGGDPGLVSQVLRVEQTTMGYKEVGRTPMQRTDYFPPTHFTSSCY
jgi:hypothetical protein